MENFILIILCISLGYIIQKLKIFSSEAPKVLNQFVIYISLPALILLEFPKIEFSISIIVPIVIGWSTMLFSALLVLLFAKILKFTKEITGALMLVTVLGNTIFLGLPLIEAYYGKASIPYILMYDQLASFIFLTIYAPFIISVYSSSDKFNIRIVLSKVIIFPPFLALLVVLVLMNTTYPYPKELTHVLSVLAMTITPVILVAVGLQLQFKMPKEDITPFATSLGIKIIISPILAILICYIFGWNDLAAKVSIMEAGMPSMITAGAMASIAGLAPRLSTAIVGYGIILSFFTTSAIYSFLGA